MLPSLLSWLLAGFTIRLSMRRGEGPGGAIGKLNGRTITVGDIQKIERTIQLIFALGMHDLVEDLTTEGRTRDDQSLSFAWNLLLLRDEAKRLQIEPTADQIRNSRKEPCLSSRQTISLTRQSINSLSTRC